MLFMMLFILCKSFSLNDLMDIMPLVAKCTNSMPNSKDGLDISDPTLLSKCVPQVHETYTYL